MRCLDCGKTIKNSDSPLCESCEKDYAEWAKKERTFKKELEEFLQGPDPFENISAE